MTLLESVALASAVCAAVPAGLTLLNRREYVPPPGLDPAGLVPSVDVVVPARNEEAGIAACVESVLASTCANVRVWVVDDASTDGTAAVVRAMAEADPRVRLLQAAPLPAGWNGKQHACWQGAEAAAQRPDSGGLLLFLDADVRLEPAAIARAASQRDRDRAALVSGFPLEQTGTLVEQLLLPLIHFILLGLLPVRLLRTTTTPGYAAGCGQFLLVDRDAYFASGGHAGIRATMHDGLLLPRLLRRHGFRTTLCDLTHLAQCRMYRSAAATWHGLSKNATEGLAAPARIVPVTLLLGLGQVLPLPLLLWAWTHTSFIFPFLGPPIRIGMLPVWTALVALLLSYLPRILNAVRFRQSALGAVLHPVGVLLLLVLQWTALLRQLLGWPATWKARTYPAT